MFKVTCFSRITMLHFVGLYYAVIDTSVIQIDKTMISGQILGSH